MKRILLALLLGTFGLSANAYNDVFLFDIIHPGEYVDIQEAQPQTSTFEIPQEDIDPLLYSAENWYQIINSPSPTAAVIYSYLSENEYNAAAASPYVNILDRPFDISEDYKVTLTNAILNNWNYLPPENFTNDAAVIIGLGINEQYPGWQTYTGKHALYHGELPDLYAVMNHEMMHSLGVASAVNQYHAIPDDPTSDQKYYFSINTDDPISIFDSYLRVYENSTVPKDLYDWQDYENYESAPQRGQAVGIEAGQYDIMSQSPYFVGENTMKVLGNSDDLTTAQYNIVHNEVQTPNGDMYGLVNYSSFYADGENPENYDYPVVYGMPIHPSDGDSSVDLSHLELRNSYMSHQDYRNWLIPMEAELAVMKDLGYDVELRKYFGKSYYLNNNVATYTEGFSEWDGDYTANSSETPQAVGIHIYGDNNTITQLPSGVANGGNILMEGEGAIGVRIDGVGNTYNLGNPDPDNPTPVSIHTNGKENLGLAVTWGSGHTINVNNGTEVEAIGEDGIAASFDFGANLFGILASDVKGSYINYTQGDTEETSGDLIPDFTTQGPLVSNFNVNGILSGEKAAIYISDNAYVDNINIGDGAEINGDIVSDWNSVTSAGKAGIWIYDSSVEGDWRLIDTDNPAEFYYTKLNLNATNGVDINGDITGDNETYNTLVMNNIGTTDFNGEEINVNTLNNVGSLNINNVASVTADFLDNNGDLNINQDTSITTSDNVISGAGNINVSDGASLNLSDINTVENTLNFNNASFDMLNNTISSINLSQTELSGTNKMNLDVDIAALTADALNFEDSADLDINSGASLEISKVNLMNTNAAQSYTDEKYYIPFISEENNNQNLLGAVTLAKQPTVLTPIFKYDLGYTEDPALNQGGFLFARGATKKYDSYNPAVTVSPVAAQMGGYLNQLNSYDQAFQNLDMKMLMTREERKAYTMANRYASTVTPQVFSPTYLPEQNKGAWFRPYSTFEKVGLNNGPKVGNISYGSYFGGDSPMFETKNGWDYQYSLYAGYNGSHQYYSGNSIYQNGGTFGGTAIWYKNDFFTALTANVGAGVADASTMYGSEDFTMLMTGIASKTGYNWELADGKFIIQPSFLISYSFVNTFDYTNAAGVRIKADPLNAINLAPGVKFIGNLKNGWQPYAGIQMVWNIMDKTDFRANNVALPDMSVKPYIQYGVGVQKRWGERFTGFLQAMMRNGGRNGISLGFGFRWALGK